MAWFEWFSLGALCWFWVVVVVVDMLVFFFCLFWFFMCLYLFLMGRWISADILKWTVE